jgi:hypothetical protein
MKGTGQTVALEESVASIIGSVTLTDRRFVNMGVGAWHGAIGGGGGTLENTFNATLTTYDADLSGNLYNAGLLVPGGAGAFDRVTVSGHFTHTYGATLAVDLGPEGDDSDQVVAGEAELHGILDPTAASGFPAKHYTVVKDGSTDGGYGYFAGAGHGTVLTIDGVRYKMLYEDDKNKWSKAVLRAVVDVGDRVWEDRNLNGVYEDWVPPSYPEFPEAKGDPPVPGAKVELYKKSTNELVGTTYSGSDGLYRFVNVLVDDYYLKFYRPDEVYWRFTLKGAGGTASATATPTGGAG